jgi:uncharacterized membrane protein
MRSINKVVSIALSALMITSFAGCYYDKEELLYSGKTTISCGTISAKFGADVNPIMKSKCATSGCHDAAGAAGGAVLVTYAQISASSARINQRCVVDKTMPTSGPLSVSEIAIIKCWIDSGSPNN